MKNVFLILSLMMFVLSCKQTDSQSADNALSLLSDIEVNDDGDVVYNKYFFDKTMRLDYFHSGTAIEEHFSIDRIVSDGIWSGSKNILIDDLKLGLYFFEIIDKESKTLLYSRGFASIFGEWQSIPEAIEKWGTFHESIRFPWPLKPVTVILKKRDDLNQFSTIWTTVVDPEDRIVNPVDLVHSVKVDIILNNGPADKIVDLVILGDGYSKNEMEKFKDDATRLSGNLMNAEPFKSRKNDFNIRAIETPAESSGVSKPHPGVFNRTPLTAHYSSFDSERYVLTYDNRTIRDIASVVPYDLMVILVNEKTYGGGGIYNLYTTVAADNKFSEYIMIHEMGHHMAALADEYYTSSVSYEMPEITVEPWETNITALFDSNNLKWRDLIETGTPLPTPWNKTDFDMFGYSIQKERDSLRAEKVNESIMEELFIRQLKRENEYFAKEKFKDKVGAFEGGGYMEKGLYRPQVDCIMFTRHMVFCKVCRRSIENVIDQYSH
jgi:IgA peptidase M64/peptidase M64-like protein